VGDVEHLWVSARSDVQLEYFTKIFFGFGLLGTDTPIRRK